MFHLLSMIALERNKFVAYTLQAMYAIFMVINYKNFLNFIYKLYSFIIYMNKKVFVIDFNNIEKIYTNKIRWIYA